MCQVEKECVRGFVCANIHLLTRSPFREIVSEKSVPITAREPLFIHSVNYSDTR